MNADLKNVFLGMLCAARCAKASTFWSCGVIFFQCSYYLHCVVVQARYYY